MKSRILNAEKYRFGIDAFMGAATLGFDRGISEFRRIGFYKGRVGGDNYYTAVDRGSVKPTRNQAVELLVTCCDWLDSFRRAATKDDAPTSVRCALVALEAAIVDVCASPAHDRLMLKVFLVLGQCQAAISRSLAWAKENYLPPLQGLSREWLKRIPDNKETRLAASLASLNGSFSGKWLPFRCHLEAVVSYSDGATKSIKYRWKKEPDGEVKWSRAPLCTVLNNILSRRLIHKPDKDRDAGIPASLNDINAFIQGEVSDGLLSDLIWSMALIDWQGSSKRVKNGFGNEPVPPSFYALLKLCFTLRSEELPDILLPVPPVPAIHRLAMVGRGEESANLALRRLKASGYRLKLKRLSIQGEQARRAASALLFRIDDRGLKLVHGQIVRPPVEE